MFGPTVRGFLAGLIAFSIIAFGFNILARNFIASAQEPHANIRKAADYFIYYLQGYNWSEKALQQQATSRYINEMKSVADVKNAYTRIADYGAPAKLGPTFAYKIVDGPSNTKFAWIFMAVHFNNGWHLTEIRMQLINDHWWLDNLKIDPKATADTIPNPEILARSILRPALR